MSNLLDMINLFTVYIICVYVYILQYLKHRQPSANLSTLDMECWGSWTMPSAGTWWPWTWWAWTWWRWRPSSPRFLLRCRHGKIRASDQHDPCLVKVTWNGSCTGSGGSSNKLNLSCWHCWDSWWLSEACESGKQEQRATESDNSLKYLGMFVSQLPSDKITCITPLLTIPTQTRRHSSSYYLDAYQKAPGWQLGSCAMWPCALCFGKRHLKAAIGHVAIDDCFKQGCVNSFTPTGVEFDPRSEARTIKSPSGLR